MKLIFAGGLPYDCPVFDFDRVARPLLEQGGAQVLFMADSWQLPWRLRAAVHACAPDERLTIHACSSKAVMAAAEVLALERRGSARLIYSPDPTLSGELLRRDLRHARRADVVLTLGDDQAGELRAIIGRRSKTCCSNDAGQRPAAPTCCSSLRIHTLTPPLPDISGAMEELPGKLLLYQDAITPGAGLERAVRMVEREPSTYLRVIGRGKGRYAMPALKLARGMALGERALWLGDELLGKVLRLPAGSVYLAPEPRRPMQQVLAAAYARQGAEVDTPGDARAQLTGQSPAAFAESLLRAATGVAGGGAGLRPA